MFAVTSTISILEACFYDESWNADIYSRSLRKVDENEAPSLSGDFHILKDTDSPPKSFDDGMSRYISNAGNIAVLKTPKFRASGSIIIQLTGVVKNSFNKVSAEIYRQDGSFYSINYQGKNFSDQWGAWRITPQNLDSSIRIVVEKNDPATTIGVADPYRHSQFKSAIHLMVTVFVSLFLMIGTGLAMNHFVFQRFHISYNPAWLVIPGVALLAMLGLLIWFRPKEIEAYIPAAVLVIGWIWILVWYELKYKIILNLQFEHKKILLLTLFIALTALGRGFYSNGPYKELYSNLICRSTETGYTSDSRISFHNVQHTIHRWDISNPKGRALFSPFFFTTRGPLAGWLVTPIVAMLRPHVPEVHPDQPWEPFDPYGFAAFRIAMTVLSSLLIIVAYGLLLKFTSASNSLMITLFLATSPFLIHESFFTWPKLACTSCFFLSVLALFERRLVLGGIMMGVSYLFHPMAMLMMPFPGLWLVASMYNSTFKDQKRLSMTAPIGLLNFLKASLIAYSQYMFGIAIVCLSWLWLNRLDYHQGDFFKYILAQEYADTWIRSRINSALNTLVPFYQFFFWPTDFRMSSPGSISPPNVLWAWQYWSTIPMGLGITFFPLCYFIFLNYFRKYMGLLSLAVVLPFITHWICFGFETNGLTRNSGHVIIFTLILVVIWIFVQENCIESQSKYLKKQLFWLLKFRTFEIFFLVFGFIFWPNLRLISLEYWMSDVLVLTTTSFALFSIHGLWMAHVMVRLQSK